LSFRAKKKTVVFLLSISISAKKKKKVPCVRA